MNISPDRTALISTTIDAQAIVVPDPDAPAKKADPRAELGYVLRLGLPAVGEQVLTMMVNLVNTMLVGYLGAAALTAVGLAGSISFLASTFLTAVAVGATTLIAQAIGAAKRNVAIQILEQALIVGLGLGIMATLVLWPLARQSMLLMGAEAESVRLGADYLCIVALSFPFLSILLVGGGALRGAGDTRSPMAIMGGMNIVNLILSYVLVRGLGAIPALGVRGAGIAATTSTILGCLAILVLLSSGHSRLRLRRVPLRLNQPILTALLTIGLPAGGETLLFRFAFLAYTRAISSLGTVAYAAYIVTQRLEGFFNMPALGFGIAATTLVGQALGANQPKRGRRAVLYCILVSLAFSLVCGLLCWFLPEPLMRLFTHNPDVLAQGYPLMRIIAVGLPTVAFALCFAGGLRGAGSTRTVMVITGVGSWVVRVPLAFLCVTVLPWGLAGVQAAMFLDYLLRALLFGLRFRAGAWDRQTAVIPKA
ncbi:MAG: MATE family efflux transporter [Anaerolineae bacterium]